jgi:hypothetical protein
MSQESRAYAISQEENNSIWYLRTLMTMYYRLQAK